jgi:hypothetical protein
MKIQSIKTTIVTIFILKKTIPYMQYKMILGNFINYFIIKILLKKLIPLTV